MSADDLTMQIRKYLGKAPFDGPENYVRGDRYFYRSLVREYGEEAVRTTINRES